MFNYINKKHRQKTRQNKNKNKWKKPDIQTRRHLRSGKKNPYLLSVTGFLRAVFFVFSMTAVYTYTVAVTHWKATDFLKRNQNCQKGFKYPHMFEYAGTLFILHSKQVK